MAGLGKRFQQEGYILPKPLVKVMGVSIFEKLLQCLDLQPTDNLYIPHVKCFDSLWFLEILKKYVGRIKVYDDLGNLKLSASGIGKNNCIIIELALPTHGAAETLLISSEFMNMDLPLLSLDCDNVYSKSPIDLVRNCKTCGIFYFPDKQPNPIYSYILTDYCLNILDIKEKDKISDMACSGGYFFISTCMAAKYAKMVVNSRVRGKEIYISLIY